MIRAIVTCYTGNDKNYYSSIHCDFTKIRCIKSEALEGWFDNSGHYMPTDYINYFKNLKGGITCRN